MASKGKTPPYSCRDVEHPYRYKAASKFFQRSRCAISWGSGPLGDFYFQAICNGPMFFLDRAPVFRQRGESGAKDGTPDEQTGSTLVFILCAWLYVRREVRSGSERSGV